MKSKYFILQKTFGLLLKRGYNGISVSDIQEATGMARGLLYHYFRGQDELVHVAVETFFESWYVWDKAETKEQTVSGLIVFMAERYNRVVREMSDYGWTVDFTATQVLFGEAALQDAVFAKSYLEVAMRRLAMWKTALLNSFGCEELRSGLNLESVAKHFMYIQEGILTNNLPRMPLNELPYTLQKGLEDFWEVIRR